MSKLYRWRLKCTTENAYKFVWNETEPTTCPTDGAHTIESEITVVDELPKNVVTSQVLEEDISTGGHWRCEGVNLINCTGNTTTEHNFTWPHRISALSMEIFPVAANENDTINAFVGPETLVGALTGNVTNGDTVINVSSTVTDNAEAGYRFCLDDGVNKEHSYIASIDAGAGTVTVSPAFTTSFSAATPTYVKMDAQIIKNFKLPGNYRIEVGGSKIGGSSVSAGTVVRVEYTNETADVKELKVIVEMLY